MQFEGDAIAAARALWRGLRRLQGTVPAEEFAAAWGHPFPAATVERLGEQLRERAALKTTKHAGPAAPYPAP